MKQFSITLQFLILAFIPLYMYANQTSPIALQKNIEIIAPLAIGEFFDKLTILMIKRERIHDPKKRIHIDKEYELLLEIRTTKMAASSTLNSLIDNLLAVNKALWNLEDLTREKERNKEFDDEFKKSIKSILKNNDTRFKIKRAINMLLDSPLIEEKSYKETLAQEIDTNIETSEPDKHLQEIPLISVPVSLADLLDRISILEIKLEKIDDLQKRINIRHEYETLMVIYRAAIEPSTELNKLYQELLTVNKRAWDIHDGIRKKALARQLDEEFVEFGRGVYYANDERVRIKHAINTFFNSALVDEKMYAQY